MSKFMRMVTAFRATLGLKETQKRINSVKNSKLSEEEKARALKSHTKMIYTSVIFIITITILMVIVVSIGASMGKEMGIIFSLISLVAFIVLSITYSIILKTKNLFPDWTNAYEKVKNEFDGLSEEEINKLKPQANEEKLIKSYKKDSFIYGIIFLIALAVEFLILLKLNIPINSPISIIVAIVITIIWYVKDDNCKVEIERIKSGYYKKGFRYICKNCKAEVSIKFDEIEKYNSFSKNDQGVIVVPCDKCRNPIPFYDFDSQLDSYKKYLEKIK